MFEPISSLFGGKQPALDEVDIQYFIERYLRAQLKTNELYCERVRDGRVTIRLASPVLQQEVRLLEYDLRRALSRELSYRLRELRITQGR